jgi:hypothetical protein
MAHALKQKTHNAVPDINPFSEKTDVIFSQIMVILSVLVTGYGFYSIFFITWTSFPISLFGLTMWGMGCLGLRRAWELANRRRKGSPKG